MSFFCLIGYRDGTYHSCEPEFSQNVLQEMRSAPYKYNPRKGLRLRIPKMVKIRSGQKVTNEYVVWVSCATCLMGYLGRRMQWLHSFVGLTRGTFRSNQIKLQNSKLSFKNIPILSSFVSEFQKCHLFCSETIRNAKKTRFKKVRHQIYFFFGHRTAKNEGTAFKLCSLAG